MTAITNKYKLIRYNKLFEKRKTSKLLLQSHCGWCRLRLVVNIPRQCDCKVIFFFSQAAYYSLLAWICWCFIIQIRKVLNYISSCHHLVGICLLHFASLFPFERQIQVGYHLTSKYLLRFAV